MRAASYVIKIHVK